MEKSSALKNEREISPLLELKSSKCLLLKGWIANVIAKCCYMITTAATYCTKFTVRHADVEKPVIKESARDECQLQRKLSRNECGGYEVDAEEEVLLRPDSEAADRHHEGEHGKSGLRFHGRAGHCQGAKGESVTP